MFLTQRRVSSRLLFAFGLALCILPGCGGGGSSTISTTTVSRTITQTFQGENFALAGYAVGAPIDQSKPFSVTAGGVPLVNGTDYTIDPNFPSIVFIKNPVPATTTVVVNCTTLALTTDRFNITSNNQTAFTLSRPADTTQYLSVLMAAIGSPTTTPVSSQNYTVTAGPPTVIRLNTAPLASSTLTISYVPKAQ